MQDLEVVKADSNYAYELAMILTEAANRKLGYADHSWGTMPYSEEEAKGYMSDSDTYLFFKKARPVGTVAITYQDEKLWKDTSNNSGYIHRLAVTEDRKGLGAEILKWTENKIAEQGKSFARLDCHADNKNLCEYYTKKGYRITLKTKGEHAIALLEKSLK